MVAEHELQELCQLVQVLAGVERDLGSPREISYGYACTASKLGAGMLGCGLAWSAG